MGFNEEEDQKSDYLALRDSIMLLKEEIHSNQLEKATTRIDYIVKEWFT